MSLHAWCEHNARILKPSPFDHGGGIAGDVVEIDDSMFPEHGLHVLEGKDAEDSIRRKLTAPELERLGLIL